jgi:RHS repeat-associated protein
MKTYISILSVLAALLLSVGSSAQSVNVNWVHLVNTSVTGTVLSTNLSKNWDAAATGSNVLWGNADGAVTYTAETTNKMMQFGLTEYPDFDYDSNTTDYTLMLNSAGSLYKKENGSTTYISTYVVNDVLAVGRVGSSIKYYKNGVVLSTSSTDATKDLYVDANLYTRYAAMTGVTVDFTTQIPSVDAVLTNIDPTDVFSTGGIQLIVSGGDGPFTYSWAHGPHYSSYITSLPAGDYTVTVTDANGHDFAHSYGVGYDAVWKDITRMTLSGTTLTSESNTGWIHAATTKNTLFPYEDGWLEYKIDTDDDDKTFGFTALPNPGYGSNDQDFSVYIRKSGILNFRAYGTVEETTHYSIGDVVRIERQGTSVFYYLNAVLVYTETEVNASEQLIGDVAEYDASGQIVALRTSSKNEVLAPNFKVSGNPSYFASEGTITAAPTGGKIPYTLSWALGVETAAAIANKASGDYTLTIMDDDGHIANGTVGLGYKIKWENLVLADTTTSDTVYRTLGTSAWTSGATSQNKLHTYQDGWVEYVVENLAENKVFGFGNPGEASTSPNDTRYGFYLSYGGVLYVRESASSIALGSYSSGDILRIERIGTDINYKQNGAIIRTTSGVDASKEYIVDLSLYGAYAQFGFVQCSFLGQLAANPTVQHVSLYQPYGSITMEVAGGYAPYSYSWSNGDTIPDLDSLSAGRYTLTITDNTSQTLVKVVDVFEHATFASTSGMSEVDGVFTKTGSSTTYGDAGAYAEGVIDADEDGWVSFEIQASYDDVFIGLKDGFGSFNYTDQRYAAVIIGGTLHSWIGGTLKALPNAGKSPQPMQPGDVIELRRKTIGATTNITLSVNGGVRYTHLQEGTLAQLVTHIGLKTPGARMGKILSLYKPGKIPTYACNSDNSDRNYKRTRSFDETGAEVSETVVFYDAFGRKTQTQARDYQNNNVMASRSVFDEWGRPVLNPLPAPTFLKDAACFKDKLLTNNNGDNYSYLDFEDYNQTPGTSGHINNPAPVNQSVKGSIGWYYSNNNTEEAYVPADKYPYGRVELYNDPVGRVKRGTNVGSAYKMGTGHEGRKFYMRSSGELKYVFGASAKPAQKVITKDAEGLITISFSDLSGRLVATATSGQASSCVEQIANHTISRGIPTRDLHIPDGETKIWFETLATLGNINVRLFDLEDASQLILGTDYTLTPLTLIGVLNRFEITFIGDYAAGHRFIRFNCKYIDGYLDQFYNDYTWHQNAPNFFLEQRLDYSQWTLFYYDHHAGVLTKTVQPESVDCDTYDPGEPAVVSWLYQASGVHLGTAYAQNTASQDLLTFSTVELPNPLGLAQHLSFTIINIPQHPEEDDNGGIALYSPCNGISGNFGDLTNPTTGLGSGATWRYASEYLQNNPISMQIASPKQISVHQALDGSKILTNGLPVGPDVDCIGFAHCYNNQRDTECGETGIDVGGDCPSDACEGIPDTRAATFRYELELYGINGGTETQVNLDGSTTNLLPIYFYPVLMRTCVCTYFWDQASLESVDAIFDMSFFGGSNNFEGFDVRLKSIGVQQGGTTGFSNFNPGGANYHDFARYMNFKLSGDYIVYENGAEPSHGALQSTLAYDHEYRVVEAVDADRGKADLVYDEQGQVRFTQTAQQQIDQNYSYSNYDVLGRVIESGEYYYDVWEYDADHGPVVFQNYAGDYSTQGAYKHVYDVADDADGLEAPYCNEVYLSSYDEPSDDFPSSTFTAYKQTFMTGQLARTVNDNSIMWYSYDEFGRLKFSIEKIIAMDGTGNDAYKTLQYTYDFLGNLLETVYQEEVPAERLYHHYNYNANQRLAFFHTSNDGVVANADLQAQYRYTLHGQLERTELGQYIQGIDLLFTIDGKLKSINNPALNSNDPGGDSYAGLNSSFAQDVFGLTIDYHENDYVRKGTHVQSFQELTQTGARKKGLYDGNIRGVRWQTRSAATRNPDASAPEYEGDQLMYTHDYDPYGQLLQSRFGTIAANGTQNGVVAGQYGVYDGPETASTNNYKVNNIVHDKNGNIQSLTRSGKNASLNSMDVMNYDYNDDTNQLNHVDDTGTAGNYADDIEDQDDHNYVYNANGQLITDVLGTNYIEYYATGKVKQIYANAAKTILRVSYTYNDRGVRLSKTNYTATGALGKTIWYVSDAGGNLIANHEKDHEDTKPLLIVTDQTLYGQGRVGFIDRSANDAIRYEITDHLGNVRATIAGALNGGEVQLLGMQDFYPYGMPLPGQTLDDGHRFGYQGQETDDETGFVNFELRQYDPRIGRWLSVDPYVQHHSPYLAMSNNPVLFIDPDGGEDNGIGYGNNCLGEGGGTTYMIDGLIVSGGVFSNFVNGSNYAEDEYDIDGFGYSIEQTIYQSSGEWLEMPDNTRTPNPGFYYMAYYKELTTYMSDGSGERRKFGSLITPQGAAWYLPTVMAKARKSATVLKLEKAAGVNQGSKSIYNVTTTNTGISYTHTNGDGAGGTIYLSYAQARTESDAISMYAWELSNAKNKAPTVVAFRRAENGGSKQQFIDDVFAIEAEAMYYEIVVAMELKKSSHWFMENAMLWVMYSMAGKTEAARQELIQSMAEQNQINHRDMVKMYEKAYDDIQTRMGNKH